MNNTQYTDSHINRLIHGLPGDLPAELNSLAGWLVYIRDTFAPEERGDIVERMRNYLKLRLAELEKSSDA